VPGNALGFEYNAPIVLRQMANAVKNFRLANNIASAQVDVIGHSMGGDVAITLLSSPGYTDFLSYGIGYVEKLITIGTPYSGAPLATALLQTQNSCPAYWLGQLASKWSITNAVIAGTQWNGGVFDLESGVQSGASNPGLATAAIASTVDMSAQTNLNTCHACGAWALQGACTLPSPLLQGLNSAGWQGIAGGPGDAIVPATSQLNGSSGFYVTGLLHSSGIRYLGFTGTAELEDPVGVPNLLINFLNTPFGAPSPASNLRTRR
jgi:pimeloyl-ACP methyl ester carboxylesterase